MHACMHVCVSVHVHTYTSPHTHTNRKLADAEVEVKKAEVKVAEALRDVAEEQLRLLKANNAQRLQLAEADR